MGLFGKKRRRETAAQVPDAVAGAPSPQPGPAGAGGDEGVGGAPGDEPQGVDIATFYAMRTGPAASGPDTYTLTVHDLGDLHLPSGRLEASDPFVNLGDGLVTHVAPGVYPVKVTVADVSEAQDGSHLREAYLSVVLGAGEPDRIEPVVPEGWDPPPPGRFAAVSVDAGTVGFADAEAVARLMPASSTTWYDEVFDNGTDTAWFALMDSPEHVRVGCANIELPGAPAGENVVIAHSGWGDGSYPLVRTVAADGTVLAIHIDLCVVGPVEEE